jgi:hypothetical protein
MHQILSAQPVDTVVTFRVVDDFIGTATLDIIETWASGARVRSSLPIWADTTSAEIARRLVGMVGERTGR